MIRKEILDQYDVSSEEELHKALRPPPTSGTKANYEYHWNLIKKEMPFGINLGPILVLGKRNHFTNILTKIAFWLLRKADWLLVKGK